MESSKINAVVSEKNVQIAQSLSADLLHQKFIEAAFVLDASIVAPFIPEDMILQGLDKYRFLADLQGHFDYIMHKHPEDFRVELANFMCNYCEKGYPLAGFEVYTGIEYAPYYRFGYVIKADEHGNTTDLYVCQDIKSMK